jgi:hypothetical protein
LLGLEVGALRPNQSGKSAQLSGKSQAWSAGWFLLGRAFRIMRNPLFEEGEDAEAAYRNIRDAKSGRLYSARGLCEYLWIVFERHADPEFRKELKSNFNARFWEMYLTASFIFAGFEVTCPKPGPDVGIMYRGQRIWFEAVSPTAGNPDSLDYIPAPKMGEVSDVPNEKMVLRYLNSISEKIRTPIHKLDCKRPCLRKEFLRHRSEPAKHPIRTCRHRTAAHSPSSLHAGATICGN